MKYEFSWQSFSCNLINYELGFMIDKLNKQEKPCK